MYDISELCNKMGLGSHYSVALNSFLRSEKIFVDKLTNNLLIQILLLRDDDEKMKYIQ